MTILSSINFLIYCSVGDKFKKMVKKHYLKIFKKSVKKGTSVEGTSQVIQNEDTTEPTREEETIEEDVETAEGYPNDDKPDDPTIEVPADDGHSRTKKMWTQLRNNLWRAQSKSPTMSHPRVPRKCLKSL